MEELQEADVLWPDAAHQHHDCHRHRPEAQHHDCGHRRRCRQHLLTDQRQQPRHDAGTSALVHLQQSPPVRIPSMPQAAEARPTTKSRHSWSRSYDDDDDDVLRGAEVGTIVPPHVLAARRCADERRVASSVCVGHGRTLKGRDLRAVRNAVLHMTGFLSSSDKY